MSKKSLLSRLSQILISLGILFSFSALTSGQRPPISSNGGPDDWTHHRLLFSDPGTADQAMRNGTYSRWSRIVNDPRYILQHEKRDVAAGGALKLDKLFPLGNAGQVREKHGTPHGGSRLELDKLPRGIIRTPANPHSNFDGTEGNRADSHHRKNETSPLHEDWSENMGSGAKTGLGMFPAKYSFDFSGANCVGDGQPDFVVYNTSLAGLSTQASIIAYDNLYSGCTGTVPTTYWAYNTGGTIMTSVVLSKDGSQVAFAQSSSGGVASLVLLKWAASTMESAGSPGTPVAATASGYRSCSAPCSLTLTFSGAANDTASSVFYDYGSDAIYVGDDSGKLHKFTGVFAGTPGEASGAWPVSVSLSALASPVFDSTSGNVLVGDYLLNLSSTCAPSGEPCGFFYAVDASTGSITGTSSRLDTVFGIADAPLVDSSAGMAYVFAGADSNIDPTTACPTEGPCSGVFQFATNFTSGSGTEATVGPGYEFMLSGAFDNEYFSSGNGASPTGHLYAVGGTGSNSTLYQVSISSNVMSTTSTEGPAVSTNYADGYYSAGLQVTEVYSGSTDYIFLSVLDFGAPSGCDGSLSNGCVMGFDVTSESVSPSTTPTGATAEAGGTSGIIVDNASTFGGASNIYYTPLADQDCTTSEETGGCAIQISQAAP
jgi:hypothetical protein